MDTKALDVSGLKIAVIGAGKMGGILLQAFLKEKLFTPEQILATAQRMANALWSRQFQKQFKAPAGFSPDALP